MTLPLILDTQSASQLLKPGASQSPIKPVDLRSAEDFATAHLPGAVRLDPAVLNRKEGSVGGLLPEPDAVNAFLRGAGLNPGDHVLAYDAGASTAAARLIWVLHAYGHLQTSWLDGGFSAWNAQQLTTESGETTPPEGSLNLNLLGNNVISAGEFMAELQNTDESNPENNGKQPSILDVRSTAEFDGSDVRSARGGHVPGASHIEWTRVFTADGLLLPEPELRQLFSKASADNKNTIEDNVVVYCQTHQRSAVTYVVLKHLGLDHVRAIDGAWSSWGNRNDTPVE